MGPAAASAPGGRTAPPDRVALAADARGAVTAVLRWRAWWMGHHLTPRLADAARMLPILLHASFPVRRLSGEAPGIAGMRFRRRWSTLARALGLPPPNRMQRGRFLVEAVIGIPTMDGLDAMVLVADGAQPEELGAVQERLEAAQAALAAAGAPVRAGLYPPSRLVADAEACHRALAFGALLGGQLGPKAWGALEDASCGTFDPRLVAALAASAPSPLSTLALTLLSLHPCPAPLPALLSLASGGTAARELADPDAFAVRWAGRVPALREPLAEALRLARPTPHPDPAEVGAVVQLGRELAHACTGAIRRSRGRLDRFAKRLWRESLGPGLPRVLLAALGDRLRALEERGPLRLEPRRVERVYEVLLPDGTCIGRGRSPVQARIRAIGLCAQARAAAQGASAVATAFAAFDPTWRTLAARLAMPREEPATVLIVEAGGGARPGPPFDMLNRGAERALEFEGAVAVAVAPGRRPAGRMLSPTETVERVVRGAPSGQPMEILASRQEGRPVAARLTQVAALLRDTATEAPVAVEAGGLVYVPFREGLRRFALDRFAARPRAYIADPASPDLAQGNERPLRARQSVGMVVASVTLASEGVAAVLYADRDGTFLRERVPLSELEEHLREARGMVSAATPPSVLTVQLSDEIEAESRRYGHLKRSVPVAVRGTLPRVEVEIRGETFGGDSTLGWDAASQALLAGWPRGGEGRIGVSFVATSLRGRPCPPLLALWAASVARRRLQVRLDRTMAAYRDAAASRNAR